MAAQPAWADADLMEAQAKGVGFAADRGAACDQALRQAQVLAVQQAIGVRVGEVSVGGVELGFYQAFIESKGVIDHFQEIGSPKTTAEEARVMRCEREIRAWVKPIPDQALQEFIQQIRRVGVLLQEPLRGENPATAALQQSLTAQGYQVVDLSRAYAEVAALIRGENKYPLLRRYLVDAVIVTDPLRLVAGTVGAEGAGVGVISRRAEGAARLVFVDQPEVPFDVVESQKAVGPSANLAQLNRKALENYGKRLAELFGPTLRQHFPASAIILFLENTPDYATYNGIATSLRSFLEGSQVIAGEFNERSAKIIIKLSEGQSGDAVSSRVASLVEGAGARIVQVSGNQVQARFAASAPTESTATEKDTESDTTLWIIIIAAGLVIIAIAVGAAILIQKRRTL